MMGAGGSLCILCTFEPYKLLCKKIEHFKCRCQSTQWPPLCIGLSQSGLKSTSQRGSQRGLKVPLPECKEEREQGQ